MVSDNSHDTDIPTLDDLVVVEKPSPARNTEAVTQETGTKPLPRNNPFLPYEHLEQLARERAEFQKQFIQYSFSKPATSVSATAKAAAVVNKDEQQLVDQLARQVTEQLVKDIRPLIERRVREALETHLAANTKPNL